MKTFFKSIFAFAVAATAFASCVKEENAPVIENSEVKTVQFFANPIETKTEFGTPVENVYPTLWSEGDKVKILVNLESVKNTEKTTDIVCSDDFKSARFEIELADPNTESYTFYSISPSVALLSKTTEKLYVTIPKTQTPLATSVDKTAQLLYAVSETTETMPTSVELAYHHLTAYGKFSLANLAADSVLSIKLEADFDIAGNWDYFVEDGSFVVRSDKGSKSITLTTTSTTDIWFACAPVDVTGKTMTLTVTTEKGDFVKELKFSDDKEFKFKAGKIAKFTVDMEGVEVDQPEVPETEWVATSFADLKDGDQVVIVSTKGTSIYAMTNNNGTSQAPATSAVTYANDKLSTNPNENIIWTVGVDGENRIFYPNGDTNKWLYCTSTNNGVRVGTNTAKAFKLDSNSGYMVHVGTSRYIGVYNNADWRCYTSINDNIKNQIFQFFVKSGSGTETPEPTPYIRVSSDVFNVLSTQTSVTFDVEANVGWGVEETEGVEVSIIEVSEDELVMTVQAEFGANETAEPKTHIVTFVPEGLDETVTVTINQAAKVEVDDSFEAGKYWIMGTEGDVTRVMTPLSATQTYGYAPSEDVTDGRSWDKNAFMFTAVAGGYTIQDASGRYYYADDTHKSFQLGDDSSAEGLVWTVAAQSDGTYVLTNVASSRTMKYGDGTYTTFGVYLQSESETGVYPTLVKADNPLTIELSSISVSGHKTSFTEGDTFEFGGTVTANYTDGTTKDVTASASVSTPEMVDGALVTVSYTEGSITKTFSYNIVVRKDDEVISSVTATVTFSTLGYANSASVDGKTITVDENVSLVFNKAKSGTAPAYYTSGSAIRMYQNGATLDVDAKGKIITNIEFKFASGHYYIAPDSGTLSAEAATRTWTGSATAVKFTSTGTDKNHRAYISEMVITYQN